MKKSLISISVGSALTIITSTAVAAPFTSFDPRSMAMGGAGVAVANTATAPFFNPSILSVTRDENDFALELPIVGVRVYDPDDFSDSISAFQDANYDSLLDNSITAVNNYQPPAIPTSQDLRDLATLYEATVSGSNTLNSGLQTLDAKPLQLELGTAIVVGVPSEKYGIAFSASMTGTLAGVINYKDGSLLGALSSDIQSFADYQNCLADEIDGLVTSGSCGLLPNLASIELATGDIINPETGTTFDATSDIHSEVNVRGMITQELALSLSREFTIGKHSVAIGITPKLVTTKVYDYLANANTADSEDIDIEDFAKEYSDFNLDIGVAKDFNNGLRTGLVIKNLISHEYETYRDLNGDGIQDPTGNHIKTSPQARLGISHTSDWHTVAVDLDLTENDPIAFEGKSRHLSLGAEFNVANWAQLRTGYRIDMSNSNRNIPSIGLGLSPLGVHLDLAASSSDNEVAASVQFGFRF